MSIVDEQTLETAWRAALRAQGVPVRAQIDVTYRCDLDCEHCYLDNKTSWPELSTARWREVLDELAAWGLRAIGWSGGEVFARPDFLELLEYSLRLGFTSLVKTHGGNVDAALARRLRRLDVKRVEISVYSLTPAVHDAITRQPGSLLRTLSGVRHLRAAGNPVRIEFTPFPSNVDEVEALNDYFVALGCTMEFNTGLYPDNAGGTEVLGLELDDEQMVNYERALLRIGDAAQAQPLPGRLDAARRACEIGVGRIYITPDGSLQPCVAYPAEFGHLERGGIRAQWESSPLIADLAGWTNASRTECRSCSAATGCSYCAGEAFKRTGDHRAAPDVFHRRTRAKVRALELERSVDFAPSYWGGIPKPAAVETRRRFRFPIYRPGKTGPGAP